MQFFDRPGGRRAPISLRGNSSRASSSSALLAASTRARKKRAEERARHAAAAVLQAAARRRQASSTVAEESPQSPFALLVAADAVARPPVAGALRQSAVAAKLAVELSAPAARNVLLNAAFHVRRKVLPILASFGGGVDALVALAASLHGDAEVAGVLAGSGFCDSLAKYVRAAAGTKNALALAALRELVDAVFVAAAPEAPGAVAFDAQFVQTVLVVPCAVEHLHLAAHPVLVPRLLAAAAAAFDGADDDECSDEDAEAVLGNVLDLAGDVWTSARTGSLWPTVSAAASLVGIIARAVNRNDAMDDDDNDDDGPLERLVQAMAPVVSDIAVRSLLNVAAAEGRHATLSVCILFNTLARSDARLKMRLQNALAFSRRADGDSIEDILPRLWSMCYSVHVPGSPRPDNVVVRKDCGPVLLVFTRAYAHLLYVQDMDEMFESGRPFSAGDIREIALVLKNTLYASLCALPRGVFSGAKGDILRDEPDLFDEVSRLLSRLYISDSRRQFRTNDDFWLWGVGHGTLLEDKFVADAVEAGPDALMRIQRQSVYGGVRQISYASRKNAVNAAGELLRVAPFMAPFSSRAKIIRKWVRAERSKINNGFDFDVASGIEVRRKFLFQDAFDQLKGLREQLKATVRVAFIDEHGIREDGADGGGLYKEFMNEVLRQGFSPDSYGLFQKTPDGLLYPNPDIESTMENFQAQYSFLGSLLGKALFDSVLVDIPFASFFLSKMLGNVNYPSDLGSLDPQLYKNLQYLKNCDPASVEDLGLNFTIVNNAAHDAVNEVELITNGRNTPVTAANRIEYIHRVSNHRMNTQLRRQTDAFLAGFSQVMRPEFIRIFSERELQLLISGAVGRIDVDDWRKHTFYSDGYNDSSQVIVWFWEAVLEMPPEDQARLLQFVTSSPRAPLLGFAYLSPPFSIYRADGDVRLPTAATCGNVLSLPNYASLELVREKLRIAMESNTGFALG